jgi:predicted transcriptional regulator
MTFLGVKVTDKDKRKLEELAESSGMTVSEVIRDMIRTGYERQAAADALREIRTLAGRLAEHKDGKNHGEDIAEIRRIVTLIARAMPSVAKHIP